MVKAITSALPTSKEEGAKIVPMGAEGSKPRVYVDRKVQPSLPTLLFAV
ncbi:hypothetical protein LEA_18495 [human gut metagenome]|uniref:Uncharacterized protein n=1 Tax=human gut metagenome TaxID=408170 RepID=K1S1H6_9ZZZZ